MAMRSGTFGGVLPTRETLPASTSVSKRASSAARLPASVHSRVGFHTADSSRPRDDCRPLFTVVAALFGSRESTLSSSILYSAAVHSRFAAGRLCLKPTSACLPRDIGNAAFDADSRKSDPTGSVALVYCAYRLDCGDRSYTAPRRPEVAR
ncbi:hypothetical protein D3C72_1405630 [compost metagenome]